MWPPILIILLINFTCLKILLCDPIEVPKVLLPHGGVLAGTLMKTVQGNPVRAFRGIPYAEPPIADLRFKAPVPSKPWSGERMAMEDASQCPSQNTFQRIFITEGDEDCLYLNVFTPYLKNGEHLLATMVYIHGGGFMTGSSTSKMYGPEKLLDHDVVLVVGNYRLGALGFLTTGTEDCPGNNGMKDQTLILKWVQENIRAFGGSPENVTIFGESAGGGSVGHHLYSKLSKGLFHKAILQSGTNFGVWAIIEKSLAVERTLRLGKILSCSTSVMSELIECLRSRKANDIASVVREFFNFDTDPCCPFGPVIEAENKSAFLTKHPDDIKIAASANVPIMTGITADEGLIKSGPLLSFMKNDLIAKLETAFPILLLYDHKPEHIQKEITKRIDDFYFKHKRDWSMENHQNLTNVLTDFYFTWGQDKLLRNRFAASDVTQVGSTYVYLFDHRGPISMSQFYFPATEYYGVCHTDELPYIFPFRLPNTSGGANDKKMKWAIPYMWTNFAKTGNPVPHDDTELELPKWKPATGFPFNYAHIGRKMDREWTLLSNAKGLFEDRVRFLRELEELYAIHEKDLAR